jgi:hypothetical protein
MLPASGTEAKRESPPVFFAPRTAGLKRPGRGPRAPLQGAQKRDTGGIAAITGHNDDSMGKFSYSG